MNGRDLILVITGAVVGDLLFVIGLLLAEQVRDRIDRRRGRRWRR